jgi:RHS repeat-associated protein
MPGVYQWDGTNLAGRTNATGSTLGDYQHAYGWAISSREGALRSTLHTDVQGTPQLITDGTGAIAGWTRTDVWGVEKAQNGAQSRLGHTGYLKDPLLGDELYAQARQYRAGVGRFTSVDEWAGDNERPLSLNKYLYGYGNPGSFVDPDGRYAEGGHYYTAFIAAKEAGYTTESALKVALYAQLPDEVGSLEAINQVTGNIMGNRSSSSLNVKNVQGAGHGITGLQSFPITNAARDVLVHADSDEAAGLAAHLLGDAYSHREIGNEAHIYPPIIGHLFEGTTPDKIVERPELYGKYARDLTESLSNRKGTYMSMDRPHKLGESLAALAEQPIADANARIEERKNGALGWWYELVDPTYGREDEMKRAEAEVTARLRERALGMITLKERQNGLVLLEPEKHDLSPVAGTFGEEQGQLDDFYHSSLPKDEELAGSIYENDSDWQHVEKLDKAQIEDVNEACKVRACF